MLVEAKKSIEKVGGKIAGVVMNKMPSDKRKDYVKYYSHYADSNMDSLTTSRRSKR